MRSEIDLTPNRDFADRHKGNAIYKKIYDHKEIPWRETKKTPKFTFSSYDDSNTMWVTSTTIDNSIQDLITTDEDGFVFNQYISSNTFNYSTSSNSMKTNIRLIYKESQYEKKSGGYKNFPTGTREEIIEKRIPETMKKIPRQIITCVDCGKKILRKPWMKVNYLCHDCHEKSLKHPNANKISKSQLWACRNNSMRNNRDIVMICNAPTISSELEDNHTDMHYYYRTLPWDKTDTIEFYYDKLDGSGNTHWYNRINYNLSERVERLALYFKEKPIGFRGTKFQPNGRVRQEYDELFESMDWKEMLMERLDKESRKEKEVNIRTRNLESRLFKKQNNRTDVSFSHRLDWTTGDDFNLFVWI